MKLNLDSPLDFSILFFCGAYTNDIDFNVLIAIKKIFKVLTSVYC